MEKEHIYCPSRRLKDGTHENICTRGDLKSALELAEKLRQERRIQIDVVEYSDRSGYNIVRVHRLPIATYKLLDN